MPDILVIKNTQISPMASSIQTLFRERMKIIDLKDIMNENLNLYNYILVFTTEELELSTILKEKITNYLKNEKTLICDLTFYISLRGGKTKKEPVKALYKDVDEKTFRYAEHIRLKKRFRICRDDLIENRPKIKIIKEKDWTKGFHIGDEIYWYGLFRPEEKYNVLKEDDLYIKKTDFGKCFWYNDEMNFKYYEKLWNDWEEKKEQYFYQNRIEKLPDDFKGEVIGISTIDNLPTIIEEKIEKGKIISMDFISPEEPIFHFYWGVGSFNKYIFVGNIINKSVKFGRYWNSWPRYEEIIDRMKKIKEKYKFWEIVEEIEVEYDEKGVKEEREILGLNEDMLKTKYKIYSLNTGNKNGPLYLYTASTHGPEGIGGLALLGFIEEISNDLLNMRDEPLKRFLENFHLKIVPVLNPYDFHSLIYRDPWACPGWKINVLNPESKNYNKIFLGHDIHGNPGQGMVLALQGNGKVVNEIINQLNKRMEGKFLNPGSNFHYCELNSGVGNKIGKMRPRQRRCLYPNLEYRLYGMDTEMPDIRIRWFSDATFIENDKGKKVYNTVGKLWPLQTYFTVPVTESISNYIYCEILPHIWDFETIDIEDKDWEVRLWKYSENQKEGLMIITYRKKNNSKITDFEYLDIIEIKKGEKIEIEKLHLDNRYHSNLTIISYPLKPLIEKYEYSWRDEGNIPPTFTRWHWLLDGDAFKPVLKSHWVLYDTDGDRKLDTYMEDMDNDGIYEKKILKNEKLKNLVFGYLAQKENEGWNDISINGFSSLGGLIQRYGGNIEIVKSESLIKENLEKYKIIFINKIAPNELNETVIKKLKEYVKNGGSIIFTLPDEINEYYDPKNQYSKANNEADWEVKNFELNYNPEKYFKEQLINYANLWLNFGVLILPKKVKNYERIHGGWCWFDRFFKFKDGFEDSTEKLNIEKYEKLMVDSFILKTISDDIKPILLLNGEPIILYGELGKGKLLFVGSSDIFSNRIINEKINEPDEWDSENLPLPSSNIKFRENLFFNFLEKDFKIIKKYDEKIISENGINVKREKNDLIVEWLNENNKPIKFSLNITPSGGTSVYNPIGKLTFMDNTIDFKIFKHLVDRSLYQVEEDFSFPFKLIIRFYHSFQYYTEVNNKTFNETKFIFFPGKNFLIFEQSTDIYKYTIPFQIEPLQILNIQGEKIRDTDNEKIYKTDNFYFGIIGLEGTNLNPQYINKIQKISFKGLIFAGNEEDYKKIKENIQSKKIENIIKEYKNEPMGKENIIVDIRKEIIENIKSKIKNEISVNNDDINKLWEFELLLRDLKERKIK